MEGRRQEGQVAYFVGGPSPPEIGWNEVQAEVFRFFCAHSAFSASSRWPERDLADLIVQLRARGTALILLGAQQAAGQFLQIGLGAGILFRRRSAPPLEARV